ncbi:MAG: DegT/DnrJ/EryC1/StrS family aminotransferase [Spirochaetaceae bacterium]|jgi:dTDP-4-amino-4,6-dideoxygalactose transaminase|nr:DegT/DnrJ/EryC1/StrS family aminotransferase [Spirochaetaceae bacterium]
MEPDIPFALPFMGREEEDAVLRVLRSGWLTTGKEALAFEKEFAGFLETSRRPPLVALAVNSATSGLHLALEACGVGPGDVVLAPSYTFTSTAEVVRYLGADAAFVDTRPGGFHIDPQALERTLERLEQGLPAYPPRTGSGAGFGPRGKPRAVIPVHYGGLPCDMDAIMAAVRPYDVRVIEDAAHAFPSRLPSGAWAGTIGDVGVFSFYATKTLVTGEGGMAVTRNTELSSRIAVMRSHGIDRSVWNRYTDKKASWYYEVVAPGFKYNLPDILAAVGRVQLTRAVTLLKRRESIAARYDAAFRGDERLRLPPSGPGDARHLYPIRLRPENAAIGRDEFIKALQDQGIGASVHFIPLHCMPYYRERYALEAEDFPESMKNFEQVISLPIWPGMRDSQVERVIETVNAILNEPGR